MLTDGYNPLIRRQIDGRLALDLVGSVISKYAVLAVKFSQLGKQL